jgi:hypothetical protein
MSDREEFPPASIPKRISFGVTCPRDIHITKAIGELKLAMLTGKLD